MGVTQLPMAGGARRQLRGLAVWSQDQSPVGWGSRAQPLDGFWRLVPCRGREMERDPGYDVPVVCRVFCCSALGWGSHGVDGEEMWC